MASQNGKPTDPNVLAIRRHYAELFAAASGSLDPRLTDIVASIQRENFVGPGPWTIVMNGRRIVTPNADPTYLYSNNLVALDDERNNGEPFLHAAWIGKIEPKPGEIVTHIGAGTGYYTAILARLVEPRGEVFAFEIDADLLQLTGQLAGGPLPDLQPVRHPAPALRHARLSRRHAAGYGRGRSGETRALGPPCPLGLPHAVLRRGHRLFLPALVPVAAAEQPDGAARAHQERPDARGGVSPRPTRRGSR